MRKLFNFVFCLVILTIVASCNSRNKIGKEMKAFYGSHIELPIDSMINVSTKGQEAYYKNARYIYVMYVDSASCSDCAITHLADWSQLNLMDAFKNGSLKYMFVVVPKQKDRKSTRLNSSHANISYAVFCLKKKIMNYSNTINLH